MSHTIYISVVIQTIIYTRGPLKGTASERFERKPAQFRRLLDIGTGSGCRCQVDETKETTNEILLNHQELMGKKKISFVGKMPSRNITQK